MTPPRTSPLTTKKPVEMFVSYSHVNAAWFKRLEPLLKFPSRSNLAHAWHDQELKAADHWDKEIREALERMDVFVALVSFEFLASDYIRNVELKRAFAREKKNEIEIVPIVLFPINLGEECPQLNAFNPLP
ncbi:MAG: toll/interleukin-1 receptor domain-containing protein, partial [bacterium]|nr:toll/interleukin-1 receptor domain-containing protein [bacterium]